MKTYPTSNLDFRSLGALLVAGCLAAWSLACSAAAAERPNILLAIGDDISWQHLGCYGAKFVRTPTFDALAKQGARFNNAYASAPGCSPSRAALLTGKHIWEIEEAGTHASNFPKHLEVYPEILEAEGYFSGYTGKPWSPGKLTERATNPAGKDFNKQEFSSVPTKGISNKDYARNFEDFLQARPEGKPFVFWFGAHEAHRAFEEGSGERNGVDLSKVVVPGFMPNTPVTREDVADYAFEIEWFDTQLGKMIDHLKQRGELDNTIVVVTADNGMAFPRAKANNYEYGVRMPLIISWPAGIRKGNRSIDDFVSLPDLAPTFLEAAGARIPEAMSAKSLLPILKSGKSGQVDPSRTFAVSGRERHTHAREDNLGYPIRAIHTANFNYIRNVHPERLPVGIEYKDVDGGPSHSLMLENMSSPLSRLAYADRPGEELYDKKNDPYCLNNLAGNPEYQSVIQDLRAKLDQKLKAGGDPRMLGYGDIFDSYPRYSSTRDYPGFNISSKYNPEYVKRALAQMKALGIENPAYEDRVKQNEKEKGKSPSRDE